ncbi:MAG: peptidylprolyl isomerase [Oscillospiraceae bacterium]
MSAKREKKQRIGGDAFGLTEKEKKDLKEAQIKHRNMIAYSIIGAVCAVAVAALLIWNSGVFQRGQTALTVGDTKYNSAEVGYFFNQALQQQYQTDQMMIQYGIQTEPSFDPAKDLKTQFTKEDATKSFHDQFLETAKAALVQTTSLYNAAVKDGFTLSDAGKQAVAETLKSLKTAAQKSGYSESAYLKLNYGEFMTVGTFRTIAERQQLISEYYTAKNTEFSTFSPEELETYYKENVGIMDSYNFKICLIDGSAPATKDADGKDVPATDEAKKAAMSAAKLQAEAMVKAVKGGEEFAVAAPKYVADAEKEAYKAPGYTDATAQFGNTMKTNGAPYADWVMDQTRTIGDIELFESVDQGYYVIQYDKGYRVDDKTVTIRHSLYGAAPVDDPATTDVNEAKPVDDPETKDVDESVIKITPDMVAAAKVKAEAAKAEFEAGDKTADSFGVIANRDSIDGGSNTKGGLYEKVKKDYMFTGFNDWIFDAARKEGDLGLVENPQAGQEGWHLIYFQSWELPEWQGAASKTMGDERTKTWMDDLQKGLEAVDADGLKYVDR